MAQGMITLNDIKPISIFLPDDPIWMQEHEEAKEYFAANGLDVYYVEGIHAQRWGIRGTHIYLLDGRPEENYYIGDGKVGTFLSWYLLYHICKVMPHSHYLILESDCKFNEGWKDDFNEQMRYVPDDFDVLFIGSCCAVDKEPKHIGGKVYEYVYKGESKWDHYPQCGYCYIIAKKAMQHLINTQRDVANPVDISLIRYSFPQLKVYAILPRLATQGDKTFISA
jgi:hypothetical protein